MTHPAKIQGHNWTDTLREPRIGVMLHYDASATDESAVAWLAGPDIKVSYNYLIADSGNIIPIAPESARAWHAGHCRSDDVRLAYRDANSAFYGVSIAATAGDTATLEAKRSLVALCRTLFLKHGWPMTEVWRIVSHRTQAVYPPGHPKEWQHGRAVDGFWEGRKDDPEGRDLAHPVLNTNEVRGMMVAAA